MQKNLFRLVEMSYSVYEKSSKIHPLALHSAVKSLSRGSLDIRRSNANYIYNSLANYNVFHDLEMQGVTPYVLPIFHNKQKLDRMVDAFGRIGISSGVYQFDVNRNMLDPKFAPCAWIPIHPGVHRGVLDQVIDIIKRESAG